MSPRPRKIRTRYYCAECHKCFRKPEFLEKHFEVHWRHEALLTFICSFRNGCTSKTIAEEFPNLYSVVKSSTNERRLFRHLGELLKQGKIKRSHSKPFIPTVWYDARRTNFDIELSNRID